MQSFLRPSHSCGPRVQSRAQVVNFCASLQPANQTETQGRYVTPELQASSVQHSKNISICNMNNKSSNVCDIKSSAIVSIILVYANRSNECKHVQFLFLKYKQLKVAFGA